MTDWSADFVSQDRQQLIPRTMGEALAKMVRARWPHSTAKHVARAWDLDPTTAGNLIKGHASERTLTKAVRAEGWELLLAIGHALTGQTHHEWEEARLQRIIEEAEHAQSRITQLRTRRLSWLRASKATTKLNRGKRLITKGQRQLDKADAALERGEWLIARGQALVAAARKELEE